MARGVKNAATHETIRSKKLRQDAIRRYLVHKSDAKAKWLAITAIKRESQVAISAGSVKKNGLTVVNCRNHPPARDLYRAEEPL